MGQRHAIANLLVLILPSVGVLLLVLSTTLIGRAPAVWSFLTFGFYAIGFLLFLIAKFSAIKGGRLISFGSREMARGYGWCYRVGFILMGLGLFLTFGLLISTGMR